MPIGKSIPKKVLNNFLDTTPKICARYKEGGCDEILTIEHPFGRSGPLSHVLIWLCSKHHGLYNYANKEYFNKNINKHYGYQQVDDKDLAKMKLGQLYLTEKRALEKQYG